MKTRYAKREGCVPYLAQALQNNLIPTHFLRNLIEVELDDGRMVKTGHIHADGRQFNIKEIYGSHTWEYMYITQLSYHDDEGNTQIVEVEPRNPHIIERNRTTSFGYVTKIQGKRWGVLVRLDWRTGVMQIIPDNGSPIIGALIQLI